MRSNAATTALWLSLVIGGCESTSRVIHPSRDAGADGTISVDVALTVRLSEKIATVGIADVDVASEVEIESLVLHYGRSANQLEHSVQVAPSTAADGKYRSPLLGLKQDTDYFVQAEVVVGGNTTRTPVAKFTTGALPNGLPSITKIDLQPDSLYGGYTIACTGAASNNSSVLILDPDGEYVWAYPVFETPVASCSRARMSYDGRSMWMGNINFLTSKGALMRVAMNGQGEPTIFELPGRHHDFAVLPNGHIVYFSQANGGGLIGDAKHDIIYELDPETGDSVELYNQAPDFGTLFGSGVGHTNYITYVPELDALSFSMREINTIGLISYPEGVLLAKFGGAETSFEAMAWSVQHGHHLFKDRLVVFSNQNENGQQSESRVLAYSYDLATKEAELTFEYQGGNGSITFGEVRELPNRNLFVTYSNSGIIQEINAQGELLRELRLAPIGYVEHRKTLYGAPPPYGE